MEWKRLILFVAGVCLCVAAGAQIVTVFGLPLGGKPPTLRPCKGEAVDSVCWDGKPFQGVLGNVKLPAESLPKWARYAQPEALIDKAGILQILTLRHIDESERKDAIASISQRFGSPQRDSRHSNGSYTSWDVPNIEIEMICPSTSECSVSFNSQAEKQRRAKHFADQKAQDSRRPATP